jgi:hypothetical protein
MTRPLLSVIIGTQGRATLPRALASLHDARIETIVVADTHGPLLSNVAETAHLFGARYAEHDAGYHDFGHPQAQIGQEMARGSWLAYLGDDDVWLPGAVDTIAGVIARLPTPAPIMFRSLMHPSPSRPCGDTMALWRIPTITRGYVTGQNIVCPNDPERLGTWGDDFDFIERTVGLYGGPSAVLWRSEVIAECY